jgi:hypothetical protein
MMNITSAQYYNPNSWKTGNTHIRFVIDGKTYTVKNGATGNRHYDEIQRQVKAGDLTIADAD